MLKAAFRAISRLGPGRLTLADVAEEAGVSTAALVQRFGSKRALLLAAAADAAGGSALHSQEPAAHLQGISGGRAAVLETFPRVYPPRSTGDTARGRLS